MNYFKIGFKVAVGWHLGKTMCRAINEASAILIKHYVPEKYWNEEHPDYPLQTNPETNEQLKMKIGFSID